MGLYAELVRPIEHRGANDHVTATELRNCLGVLAAFATGERDVPKQAEPVRRGSVDNSDPPEREPENASADATPAENATSETVAETPAENPEADTTGFPENDEDQKPA